jgi:superoxide dismutase, Fe-Mn family
MKIESPALPYNLADLEPVISRDSLMFHLMRHQRLCHDRMRALVAGTPFAELSLEDVIRATASTPAQHQLFHCAAETWNHELYWHSMRARGGGAPHGAIADLIRRHYGGYERFAREFRDAANAHFGSGWLFVVWRRGTLTLVSTINAGTPLVRGDVPLLALDLWEHAYYLDFQNRRAAYVHAFLEDLVDWDCANRRLEQMTAGRLARTLRTGSHVAGSAAPL